MVANSAASSISIKLFDTVFQYFISTLFSYASHSGLYSTFNNIMTSNAFATIRRVG